MSEIAGKIATQAGAFMLEKPLGGRGIPYRFGSRTDTDGQTQDWTIESLKKAV